MATQTEIAQHLDLTQPTVAKLVALKILNSSGRGGLDYDECRVAYIQHLRKIASGRSGDLTLTEQRTRHAKESADKLQMQNELRRGEIVEYAPFVRIIGEMLSGVRGRLLAIPAERTPHLLRAKTAPQMQEALHIVITEALEALCEGYTENLIKSAPLPKDVQNDDAADTDPDPCQIDDLAIETQSRSGRGNGKAARRRNTDDGGARG